MAYIELLSGRSDVRIVSGHHIFNDLGNFQAFHDSWNVTKTWRNWIYRNYIRIFKSRKRWVCGHLVLQILYKALNLKSGGSLFYPDTVGTGNHKIQNSA